MIEFKLNGQDLFISRKGSYMDGTPALKVTDRDGIPWCTLTVYVEGGDMFIRPEEGEFLIKSWSENESTYDLLVKEGILIPTGREIQTGFVTAKVCKLSQPL